MGDPIQLLIYFLVAIIVLAIIWYATGLANLPGNVRSLILLVAVVLVLLWLMRAGGLV